MVFVDSPVRTRLQPQYVPAVARPCRLRYYVRCCETPPQTPEVLPADGGIGQLSKRLKVAAAQIGRHKAPETRAKVYVTEISHGNMFVYTFFSA